MVVYNLDGESVTLTYSTVQPIRDYIHETNIMLYYHTMTNTFGDAEFYCQLNWINTI